MRSYQLKNHLKITKEHTYTSLLKEQTSVTDNVKRLQAELQGKTKDLETYTEQLQECNVVQKMLAEREEDVISLSRKNQQQAARISDLSKQQKLDADRKQQLNNKIAELEKEKASNKDQNEQLERKIADLETEKKRYKKKGFCRAS